MTETYDVTLSGTGYMVKPGAYQRFQDGQTEGRVGRVRVFDFYGGGKRAAQLERDRFWTGVGAWPTLDSQGVIAGPPETDRTLTPSTAFVPTDKHWAFGYGGYVYIVSGSGLYQCGDELGGSFSDLTLVHALSATCVSCCMCQGVLYFAYGSAANGDKYDLNTSTYTYNAIGGKADLAGVYGVYPYFTKNGGDPNRLYTSNVGSTSYAYDSEILALPSVDGSMWVLTRGSVWDYRTAIASTPQMSGDDDYAWAIGHFGRVWTWGGKEILYYDTADSEFKGTGIRGQATRGACSVGSWLVVVVDDLLTGNPEYGPTTAAAGGSWKTARRRTPTPSRSSAAATTQTCWPVGARPTNTRLPGSFSIAPGLLRSDRATSS